MTVLSFILPDFPTDDPETAANEGHIAEALARSPEYIKGKQNWTAIVSALVSQVQEVEDALQQLATERGVDTAVGAQLAIVGAKVGEPDTGLDTEIYRRRIRARIAANRSSGTIEQLIQIGRLIVYDTAARMELERQNVAHLVYRVRDAAVASDVADVLIAFLRDAKLAGVRLLLETSESDEAGTFTMAQAAFCDGIHSNGSLDLVVHEGNTASFPEAGDIVIDPGGALEEPATYIRTTHDTFRLSALTTNNHADGTAIILAGADDGLGFGDDAVPADGGTFASALA
jgi:hypothetical protein